MASPHLLLLHLMLAGVVAASGSNAEEAGCPTYHCGRAVPVQYPFCLGADDDDTSGTSEHCGYPALRLQCVGDAPVLPLPSGDYGVKRISYRERTLTVVDLEATGAACPSVAGRNLTVAPPLALTAGNSILTFFVDCSFDEVTADLTIPCLQHGINNTYFFPDDVSAPYDVAGLCHEIVAIPVLKPREDVVTALNRGFELGWRPAGGAECRSCEKAGGLCGRRRETPQQGNWTFECFMKNSTAAAHSDPGHTLGMVLAIIGTVVAAVGLFFLFNFFRKSDDSEGTSSGQVSSIFSPGFPPLEGR